MNPFLVHKLRPCKAAARYRCPQCKRESTCFVSKSYGEVSVFHLPILRGHRTYLATCAHCGHTMELSPIRGRELERTGHTRIEPKDLAEMNSPIVRKCTIHCQSCGRALSVGKRFCPGCGRPLTR